jgi:hypothetical protein
MPHRPQRRYTIEVMGEPSEPKAPLSPIAPVLEYATPAAGGLVEIARFPSMAEASLSVAALAEQGITSQLLNAHTNALNYGGIAEIELVVGAQDADRAIIAMDRARLEELEPAEERADPHSIRDEQGREWPLAAVASFETVHLMRDAQTVLLSEHIKSYPPELVVRVNRPSGFGKRFILRVREEDLPRATRVISEAAAEDDDPRCPRCRSWQVRPIPLRFLVRLAVWIHLIPRRPDLTECQMCGRRGVKEEFAPIPLK